MKAADLSEREILQRIRESAVRNPDMLGATHWSGYRNSIVLDGDPPEKVLLAKLRAMHRRGIILGCSCGCRGDWRLP